jgi:CheY-like chemotaxis protein
MRILVLDDEQEIVDLIARMLCDMHAVEGVTDAARAIEMLKEKEYDFILVDYKMPEHDGIWFMQNAQLPRKTKALLLTGNLDRAMLGQMFRLGVSGYLIKPVDGEELLRHLDFHSQHAPGK